MAENNKPVIDDMYTRVKTSSLKCRNATHMHLNQLDQKMGSLVTGILWGASAEPPITIYWGNFSLPMPPPFYTTPMFN